MTTCGSDTLRPARESALGLVLALRWPPLRGQSCPLTYRGDRWPVKAAGLGSDRLGRTKWRDAWIFEQTRSRCGKLLGMEDEPFRIPHYQRAYSWTWDQIDDLWDDLVENAARGHFLGSLVLASENESKPQVIDGQQRLTTLMILLSVLRDACLDRGMTKDAQKIQTRLIAVSTPAEN